MGTCMSKNKAKKASSCCKRKNQNQNQKQNSEEVPCNRTVPVSVTSKNAAAMADSGTHPRCEKPVPEEAVVVKEILSETKNCAVAKIPEPRQEEPAPALPSMETEVASSKPNNNNNSSAPHTNGGDVDAILIQCGRLSRSSSGSGQQQKRSGSKRHAAVALDGHEPDTELELNREREPRAARPTHRRRPSSDMCGIGMAGPEPKRSASHERSSSSSNGRRISPSPVRRGEPSPGRRRSDSHRVTGSAGQQSGTTARRHVARSRSPGNARVSASRDGNSTGAAARVSASNDGSLPAAVPCLSRSSSRKAEQSPLSRTVGEGSKPTQNDDDSSNLSSAADAPSSAQISVERRVALKEISANANGNIREHLKAYKAHKAREQQQQEASLKDQDQSSAKVQSSAKDQSSAKAQSSFKDQSSAKVRSSAKDHSSTRDESFVASAEDSENRPDDQQEKSERRSASCSPLEARSDAPPPMTFVRSRSQRRSREHFILDSQGLDIPASVSKAASILEAVADLNSSVNSNSLMPSNAGKSFEDSKSARFVAEPAKFSSNFDLQPEDILRDFQYKYAAEQSLEESAASNGLMFSNQSFSEDSGELSSFTRTTEESARNSSGGASAFSHSHSNPSNLLPVVTLARKEFVKNGGASSSLSSSSRSAVSEPRRLDSHRRHDFFSDMNFRADSCPAS